VLRRQKVCSPSGCLSAWPALLAANSLVHAAARTRARPPPPPPTHPPTHPHHRSPGQAPRCDQGAGPTDGSGVPSRGV
jgi:hypothetical protein